MPGREGDAESRGTESVSNTVALAGGRIAKLPNPYCKTLKTKKKNIKNSQREDTYDLKGNKSRLTSLEPKRKPEDNDITS